MMRIILFLLTNAAVLLLASVVMMVLRTLGIIPPDSPMTEMMIYCAVFGFGGSFVSLAMSKWIAKRAMRVRVIEQPRNDTERWLVDVVRQQAKNAGIGMPEVGIFESRDPNAFATGMSKNNALVAVSSGLLSLMSRDEAEAVMGHEISHVANGDMVTLALIQGVVNTFVLFIANIVASQFRRGMARYAVYFGLQIALGFLASAIVAWFSRRREFRADAGGAKLKSAESMASALGRLAAYKSQPTELPEKMAAFGIRGEGVMRWFSTHPPIEERIARLRH